MGFEYRHVVWDWNGTLLDDTVLMLAAVNDVCLEYGVPPITLDLWQAALRRPLWLCYTQVLGREITEETWPEVERAYHESYRRRLLDLPMTVGVPAALDAVEGAGLTQSVLSMGFHDDVRTQVDAAGISRYFTAVDGVRARVSGGAKAEHLALHLDRLGLQPWQTVMIGDVVDDADAALAVGADVILVATGMTALPVLEATGARSCASIADAMGLLLGVTPDGGPATSGASSDDIGR